MSERAKGANTAEEWRELRATMETTWTVVWSKFPRSNMTFGPLTRDVEAFLDADEYAGRYFIDTNNTPPGTMIPGRVLFENPDAAFNFKMFYVVRP